MTQIKVTQVEWHPNKEALKEIRNQVFIEEQGVPVELEWDDLDENSEHWLGYIDNTPVACARVIDKHKIGRMAVLRPYRQMGIGGEMLSALKDYYSKQEESLSLSAQCHAYSFYQANGFSAYSAPYEDANIPHIDMKLQLPETLQYALNHDSDIYHGDHLIQAKGFLDLALCQTRRNIIICIKDTSHPILRYPSLCERIKQLCKQNRRFKVYLLLTDYQPKDNEHPLFRLQDRLPSFIEIKQSEETLPCQILMDSTAWFDCDGNDSRVCFSDKGKVKLFLERFNQWWHNAKPILDSKRLSI